MLIRNCDRCGEEYEYRKCLEGKTKYCSRSCKPSIEMRKKLICKFCKSEFVYGGPRSLNYEAKTCSKQCANGLIGVRNKLLRKNQILEMTCSICGNHYQTTRSKSKTCSKHCHGLYLSEKYKGRKLSEEWIKKQNESKTKDKIVKYGKFACDRCGKIFEKNTSLRAHKARCGKDISLKCDICNKTFKNKSGLGIHKNHHDENFNKKHTAAAQKMVKTRKCPRSTSKSEESFFESLKKILGMKVQHKFRIDGYSHEYDIFIPELNLIIEFDGDYWHGNKSTQDFLTPRMKQQYQIDKSHNEKAILCGYNILRVWSSESNDFLRRIECSLSKSSLLLEMSNQSRSTISK
jgi:very-short-patch-repair endonuclease